MMEEVSITVAYDAHVINQICDEDIFASLVADSKPKPTVGKTMQKLPNLSLSYLCTRTLAKQVEPEACVVMILVFFIEKSNAFC